MLEVMVGHGDRRDGAWSIRSLVRALEADPAHLANVLSSLSTMGKIERVDRGVYWLPVAKAARR